MSSGSGGDSSTEPEVHLLFQPTKQIGAPPPEPHVLLGPLKTQARPCGSPSLHPPHRPKGPRSVTPSGHLLPTR